MKRRGITVVLSCILALGLLTGCGSKKQFFTITTGGTGGTYYPIGGAIADTLTKNVEGLTATAQAGNTSVANCNLIKSGETESALVQNNVAFWAYEGVGAFEGSSVENLRGIASLYPEAIQLVALKESGIESVEDLVGKKVSVGELGSGVDFDVQNIFEVYGLTYEDMTVDYLSFSEASSKLKDKQLDAAFVTAGYPTSSITDVALAREINIIEIPADKIAELMKTSPYYSETVIPAGTYDGVDEDVTTATTMAMWVVDESADEDLVYEMTKAMWENRDTIEEAHEKGKVITIDTALDGMGIPLHPGAEKYYAEQNIK